MTDAINFFQSFLTFGKIAKPQATKPEIKLAVALKIEAEKLEATAAREMRNGDAARHLVLAASDRRVIQNFSEIAVWHYGQAIEKFAEAAQRFEESGKIQTGESRLVNAKARQMQRAAASARAAVSFLNSFLISRQAK